ncbi:unnamed protein product [Owenia fusiformis]|uniref:Uncharacterized protein n=1 Tax=Owenia fusiformis TaxID=6347 RepID=A0A8J1UBX1_OWEFU|nr:unnamed protein product [Owenia fusiformis]
MEMITIKTVAVIAIIMGCFLTLYPRIFHPMVKGIFGDSDGKRKVEMDDVHPRGRQHPIHHHASMSDDVPPRMRGGPNPGMRAHSEMRKETAATGGGKGGIMMMVLPMYAVGIVLYLIYTLTKVFSRKSRSEEEEILHSQYRHMEYDGDQKEFVYGSQLNRKKFVFGEDFDGDDDYKRYLLKRRNERELEKLIRKSDEGIITLPEMKELRSRLHETEMRMTRILHAMEHVEDKVHTTGGLLWEDGDEDENCEEIEVESPYTHNDASDRHKHRQHSPGRARYRRDDGLRHDDGLYRRDDGLYGIRHDIDEPYRDDGLRRDIDEPYRDDGLRRDIDEPYRDDGLRRDIDEPYKDDGLRRDHGLYRDDERYSKDDRAYSRSNRATCVQSQHNNEGNISDSEEEFNDTFEDLDDIDDGTLNAETHTADTQCKNETLIDGNSDESEGGDSGLGKSTDAEELESLKRHMEGDARNPVDDVENVKNDSVDEIIGNVENLESEETESVRKRLIKHTQDGSE